MSYILDALRKADAERDRGNVPGIHAQPSFGGAMPTGAPAAPKPWLWLASGAGVMLVVAALAWYLTGPTRLSGEAPAPITSPTPSPIGPAPTTIADAPAPVAPAPIPPVAPTRPTAVLVPKPATAATPARKPAVEASPSTAPVAQTPAEAKPTAASEKVYAVAELPDDVRRQLPNVAVGGSMYSPKPADRILIINGQVFHEGDTIAPDLTLQQIRLKGALLNFRGYRYAISF